MNLPYNTREPMGFLRLANVLVVLIGGLGLVSAAAPDGEIEALVERLDDERFAIRDKADRTLRESSLASPEEGERERFPREAGQGAKSCPKDSAGDRPAGV